jgi:ABC-type glutathione transport system ATPase component
MCERVDFSELAEFPQVELRSARATLTPVRGSNSHSGTKKEVRGWGGNPTGDKIAGATGTFPRWGRQLFTVSHNVLEAHELSKRYGAVTAVREISFAIQPGQILGVLGPNGAGKSTIVKMVTGLINPSRGAVLFHGERIGHGLSAFKRRLGYVPEQPDLYGFLTGMA